MEWLGACTDGFQKSRTYEMQDIELTLKTEYDKLFVYGKYVEDTQFCGGWHGVVRCMDLRILKVLGLWKTRNEADLESYICGTFS